MTVYKPTTADEVSEIIKAAREPFEVIGSGSKRSMGHAVDAANTLDLSSFNGVIAYEPEELIIEAGAATPLADVQKLLDSKNQMLAFEPPQMFESATLGGVLGCNLSGPRRLTAGAVRDHILGVTGVDGRGTIFKGGGRVVKNVTGYDMPKLIAGSYGTLAVITSLVFKVLPRPETELTLIVAAPNADEAVRDMFCAMATAHSVSCAAYLPGRGVLLQLEGIRSSVDERLAQLAKTFKSGPVVLHNEASAEQWRKVRDLDSLLQMPVIWRVSVSPAETAKLVDRLSARSDFGWFLDWAGGLVWIGTSDTSLDVRAHMDSGHAMLFKAPQDMKQRLDVFHPQSSALAALTRRVKDAFDPDRKLNPGRMYKGL